MAHKFLSIFEAEDVIKEAVKKANNAHVWHENDGYGIKLTVRTHEGDTYELFENGIKLFGNILVFKEDGTKANGSIKYKCERIPMNTDSIKKYVRQDYLAKVFDDIIFKDELYKGVPLTYNDLLNKVDDFNGKEGKEAVFIYSASNWKDVRCMTLKDYIVTDVIETMAFKYGNDIVSDFAAKELQNLSEHREKEYILRKYASDYGINYYEYDDLLQIEASMEVNGCKWTELPEVNNVLNEIVKEHTEQMKGR
ncbi:hypothetical protein IKQ26_01705 [bacterium]|nr:hypothetical protein [bacterium]